MSERDLTRETGRPRLRLVDVAVVGVLLLLLVGYYLTPTSAAAPRGLVGPDVTAYVLVALASLMLLVWRRFPVAVFAAVAVLAAMQLTMGYAFGPIMLQLILATGMVTWRRRGRILLGLGAGYGLLLATAFTVRCLRFSLNPVQMLAHWPASALLWIALPAAVGTALRIRREAAARLRLERSRRAASEEQLRLAQELHDVVGHGLAVIAMQAGSGQHVLGRDPERARLALQAIEETARTSLDGLRAEIGSLRGSRRVEATSGADPDGAEPAPASRWIAPLRPYDGIADLQPLVERIRRGGPTVVLELDPQVDPGTLPAEVDHAAYRIVQESLTNVLRHADARAVARVLVRAVPGPGLLVEVSNTGPAHGDDHDGSVAGLGIQGMIDRARRLGGQVEAGPQGGGGFRVTAHLPLPALAG